MTIKLDQILDRGNNNFDLVRLISALLVIFGHSFSLHPTGGWGEPVRGVFGFTYSGALAVDIFFFLSGILITSSYCRSGSVGSFLLMRWARIWPGLTVCLLFTVLVVGPVVSAEPWEKYFGDGITYRYFFRNILLKITYVLPGVFDGNHYPSAVNGSLWTLPIEVRCYLLVLVFGVLGGFYRRRWSVVLVILIAGIAVSGNMRLLKVFSIDNFEAARLPLIFVAGIFCYVHRRNISIHWSASIVSLLVAVVARDSLIGAAALYFFAFNTALVVAGSSALKRLTIPGDYSYGIYIYGFVVQQCVAHVLPDLTSYPSLLISIPVSVSLAVLSWHWVESPALCWARGRSIGRMRPKPAASRTV